MRARFILWSALFLLTVSAATLWAGPPPAKIVLKACAKRQPPVTLPHQQHIAEQKITCKACHHTGQVKKSCTDGDCHAGKATPKRPGCTEMAMKKNVFHTLCRGCHQKKKAGPQKCPQCHKK